MYVELQQGTRADFIKLSSVDIEMKLYGKKGSSKPPPALRRDGEEMTRARAKPSR